MEQIWAPWRMEYIRSEKSGECVFCTLPREERDEENFILYRGADFFIIMNIYPYNTGHLMVAPYRHVGCITRLDEKQRAEKSRLTHRTVEILRNCLNPEGFNIGINLGKAGGAGYEDHVHEHIVPRWTGDTNFMPVLADVKIHPEHLRSTYDRLRPHFKDA
ncbi:MAG: HIT domain-containing protein [Nitrospinaceae bacterium]|jgi:ATP adenylyltransferase|nr:MAG: HIT domain-containing protein [Nitrospinaceae bacterium]